MVLHILASIGTDPYAAAGVAISSCTVNRASTRTAAILSTELEAIARASGWKL
jgi:hypothetical protein